MRRWMPTELMEETDVENKDKRNVGKIKFPYNLEPIDKYLG